MINSKIDEDTGFFKMSCEQFLTNLKSELSKDLETAGSVHTELEQELTTKVIEIAELLVPENICGSDGRPSRSKVKTLLFDIVDAFCD